MTTTKNSNLTKQRYENMLRMIFASSCIEAAARATDTPTIEMYQRMKDVDLINSYILKHYNAIHTESREAITEDILGCLADWEERKANA